MQHGKARYYNRMSVYVCVCVYLAKTKKEQRYIGFTPGVHFFP